MGGGNKDLKTVIKIGSYNSYQSNSIDVSTYCDKYASLTAENFIISVTGFGLYTSGNYRPATDTTFSKVYSAPTLTIGAGLVSYHYQVYNKYYLNYDVYIIL